MTIYQEREKRFINFLQEVGMRREFSLDITTRYQITAAAITVLKGAGVIKKVRPGFFIATGATVPTAKELMDTCTSYSVQKRTKREQKNTSVSNAVAPEEKVKIEHHGQVQIPLVVPAQPKKTDRDILIENINQAAYSKGHTQNEVLSAMASILHDNGWKLERPVFSTVPFKPE